jgi:hypothetical protein
MIVVLIVLGFQTRDRLKLYFAKVGTLEVDASREPRTLYLKWQGKIAAPMASRIADAFASHREGIDKVVLSMSSPGGAVDQGADVIRLLQRISQTHQLTTLVEADDICASMCVPIYLQGQRRLAASDAEFMFHEISFRDFFSKKADRSVPQESIGAETDRFFARYFVTAGVSQDWIRQVRAEIAGGREVWKNGRELVDEKSGVVQQLQ